MQAALRFPRTTTLWLAAGGALALAALFAATALLPVSASTQSGAGVQTEAMKLPLSFEPNAGRAPASVDYIAHSVAGGDLALRSSGATLALPSGKHGERTLGLDLRGSNPAAAPTGVTQLPGKANVFIGDDPSKWRSGLPTFSRVRYEQAYPGIDVDWYGNQRRLEYDFRIAPGADPKRIGFDVSGADSLRVARNGELVIGLGNREIRQAAPVAFQTIGGERRAVASAYELHGSSVGFRLGDYDHSQPLVIDPLVVGYSTYLGGTDTDFPGGIAVDSAGAAYVAGKTFSSDFPTQDQFQPNAGVDAFVAKLNPDSGGPVTLAYSTYLGGAGDDDAGGIAIDSAGAAYVTGSTKADDFPTVRQYEADSDTDAFRDAFVTKLNPDTGGAVTLGYSTYIGGSNHDSAQGIAVDPTGAAAYIAGTTSSTDYDTVDEYEGDPGDAMDDEFLTKVVDPGGAMPVTLGYSTYLGGGNLDTANAVAIDSTGAAYVAGGTASTDFDTVDQLATGGTNGAGFDATVAKFNPEPVDVPESSTADNVTLAYSSYLAGGATDSAAGIGVDSTPAAYVTGRTSSTDFPTQDGIAGQASDANGQAFVSRILDPGGANPVTLGYSTYLGGTNDYDEGDGIAVDPMGAAWITGEADSTNFPAVDPLPIQSSGDSGGDVFVAKIGPDPGGAMPVTLAFSTVFGGATGDPMNNGSFDGGYSIAPGPGGDVFVAGETDTTDFPTHDGLCGQTGDFDGNAFVMRLAPSATSGSCSSGGGSPPAATSAPAAAAAGPTGQRAAALKKCKKKKGAARKKCKKRANKLPV